MASKATMVRGVIINATTFVAGSYLEKYEEIKRHDLTVFLTKIAGALAIGLAASQFSSKSTEWLRRLPEVASALNREETRFAGKKPVDTIREKAVSAKAIKYLFSTYSNSRLEREKNQLFTENEIFVCYC